MACKVAGADSDKKIRYAISAAGKGGGPDREFKTRARITSKTDWMTFS